MSFDFDCLLGCLVWIALELLVLLASFVWFWFDDFVAVCVVVLLTCLDLGWVRCVCFCRLLAGRLVLLRFGWV